MPLVGDSCGRVRLPMLGLTFALFVVCALCAMVPPPGFAAVSAHASGVQDGCANATVSASTASQTVMREAVVCLVNYERSRYHLPPLHPVRKLTRSAQRYTSQMVRHHFFSHTAPNGSTPGGRIAATGYHWSWAGENIASGYPTPLSVVTGWMHSQGHCYNMLAPVFRNIGVGEIPHAVAGASEPATWTQDFGLRLGQHAPSGNWGPANSCPH